MDIFSIARACLRRWYVLLPLLAITAGAAYWQGRSVEAQYSASASAIVVAPSLTAQRTSSNTALPVNPLGSISAAQTALVVRLNSAESAAAIAQASGGVNGGVVATPERTGAIIDLTAGSSSAAGASAVLDAALRQLPVQLQRLQADIQVPTKAYFRIVTLTGNQGVSVDYPSRSKNIVLAALAGALISVILVQLLDAVVVRRRRGRHLGASASEANGHPSRDDGTDPTEESWPFEQDSAGRNDGETAAGRSRR